MHLDGGKLPGYDADAALQDALEPQVEMRVLAASITQGGVRAQLNQQFYIDGQPVFGEEIQVADTSKYSPEQTKLIENEWNRLSLDELKDNIFDLVDNIEVRDEQGLVEKLTQYAKELNLIADISGMGSKKIIKAMLQEYYELMQSSNNKLSVYQQKDRFSSFFHNYLEPEIREYIK